MAFRTQPCPLVNWAGCGLLGVPWLEDEGDRLEGRLLGMSGSCGAGMQLPRVPLDLRCKTKLGLGHEGVEGILHPDAQFPPTRDSVEPPGSSATRFHVCARALSARAVSRVNR